MEKSKNKFQKFYEVDPSEELKQFIEGLQENK